MIFSNNSNFPIGLDISDLSLKLVQLNKAGQKINIQAISNIDLKEGLIVDGVIKNKAEVIVAIKKLISNPKYGKVTSSGVVACLPESKTFVKLIEIKKTPNHISDIIESELEKHVPFMLSEIYYDWQIIEEVGDRMLVLIGAAVREVVDQHIDLLSSADLMVEALEVEPMALCRALLKEESPEHKVQTNNNYAIVDIGAVRTSMVVYSNSTILFTVKIPLSGDQITSEIAKKLELEKDQAEKVKIVCGFNKDSAEGVVNNLLLDMINNLNEKVEQALDFYNNNFSKRGPISEIYLCGGGANIKDIDRVISGATSIHVKKADALVNLTGVKEKFSDILSETYKISLDFDKDKKSDVKSTSKSVSVVQNNNLTYTTAIGLALRPIFIKD